MLKKSARAVWKQVLWWTRFKIIYSRITLTKFTTIYFFLALVSCITLAVLQAVAFADNSEAAHVVSDVLKAGNATNGLAFYLDGALLLCNNIPVRSGANCSVLSSWEDVEDDDHERRTVSKRNTPILSVVDASGTTSISKRGVDIKPKLSASGQIQGAVVDGVTLNQHCLSTLMWVHDVLHDAKREDVVTLAFQIWLFSLSFLAILNESLPHLTASLFGHILGTAWAGYRVSNSKRLHDLYLSLVVAGPCQNKDLLGDWWDLRTQHTIPVVVINVLVLLAMSCVSFRLFKIYASQSFSRVGASPEINKVYKIVLLFSVSLQLAGFFTLASTGMWIDRVTMHPFREISKHINLYLAAFITTAIVELPWLLLGWISVRRESRRLFLSFCAISGLLFAISTFMFASPLYRFMFMIWPLFGNVTVVAYILIVSTSVLGVFCRLHFGKGLAHFLRVTDALEDVDFTPVCFSTGDETPASFVTKDEKGLSNEIHILSLPYIQVPKLATMRQPGGRAWKQRPQSIYSDAAQQTIKLSTTPYIANGKFGSQNRDSNSSRLSAFTSVSSGGRRPDKPSQPKLSTGKPRELTANRGNYI